MLTARSSAPNTLRRHAQSTPTPSGWQGVSAGMESARVATTHGDYKQAILILEELLVFAPAEVAAWRMLAKLQRRLGHIEAGIASATRALQLQNAPGKQQQPMISLTLAKLLWSQGEKMDAHAMLAMLIERQPESIQLQQLKSEWLEEIQL